MAVCIGGVSCDVLYELDQLPKEGARSRARTVTTAGGSLVRSARLLAALGYEVHLHTCMAEDMAAGEIRRELSAAGVEIVATPVGHTPLSSVFIGELDRAIVSSPRPGGVPQLPDTPMDLLICDGHALDVYAAAASQAAIAALDAGNGRFSEAMDVISRGSTELVTGHLGELEEVYGAHGAEAVAERVLDTGVKAVVFTDGGGLIQAFDRDGCHAVQPRKVRGVDTAGCGDVFHAALSGAIGLGHDLGTALVAASEWASRHASIVGNGQLDLVPDILS